MQKWINICESINVINHINRTKENTHTHNLLDETKAFAKK